MNCRRTLMRSVLMCVVCMVLMVWTAMGVRAALTSTANVVKVPALMYHHISEEYDEENAGVTLTPEEFRAHMEMLAQNYTVVPLRAFYEHAVNGTELPENPIVITFDDGYASNYETAYPILKERNLPATIFVVTATVGETPEGGKVGTAHFTWEQAREMQQSGLIEIQSHSNTHAKLAEVSFDQLHREMRLSKYLIEKNLGTNCDMFAYPYGSYNDRTKLAARQAGYKLQILVGDLTKGYVNEVNVRTEGTESLKRITVEGNMSAADLQRAIEEAKAAKTVN